jgi:hypothetical protein
MTVTSIKTIAKITDSLVPDLGWGVETQQDSETWRQFAETAGHKRHPLTRTEVFDHDFDPTRTTDGKLCMYDLVSKVRKSL